MALVLLLVVAAPIALVAGLLVWLEAITPTTAVWGTGVGLFGVAAYAGGMAHRGRTAEQLRVIHHSLAMVRGSDHARRLQMAPAGRGVVDSGRSGRAVVTVGRFSSTTLASFPSVPGVGGGSPGWHYTRGHLAIGASVRASAPPVIAPLPLEGYARAFFKLEPRTRRSTHGRDGSSNRALCFQPGLASASSPAVSSTHAPGASDAGSSRRPIRCRCSATT